MSRLAISNIAWTPEEEPAAFELLRENGVCLLEIAPTRFWPDVSLVEKTDVEKALRPVREAELEVIAFQALLFGKADWLLFDNTTRPLLAGYLIKMAQVCAWSGAKTMVFGAPGNRRVPEEMSTDEANDIAVDFFRGIGRHALDLGVTFGIEANPSAYNCNFCTHANEVIELVRHVQSPGIRWHIDAGELAMNSENIEEVIQSGHDLISYTHLSEAMLAGFEAPWEGHAAMVSLLEKTGYKGYFSIEMKRQPNGLVGVAPAIDFARSLGIHP